MLTSKQIVSSLQIVKKVEYESDIDNFLVNFWLAIESLSWCVTGWARVDWLIQFSDSVSSRPRAQSQRCGPRTTAALQAKIYSIKKYFIHTSKNIPITPDLQDIFWPIRGQCPVHVIPLSQSEARMCHIKTMIGHFYTQFASVFCNYDQLWHLSLANQTGCGDNSSQFLTVPHRKTKVIKEMFLLLKIGWKTRQRGFDIDISGSNRRRRDRD